MSCANTASRGGARSGHCSGIICVQSFASTLRNSISFAIADLALPNRVLMSSFGDVAMNMRKPLVVDSGDV